MAVTTSVKLYCFASIAALSAFVLIIIEAVNYGNSPGGMWNGARIWSAVWILVTAIVGIRQLKSNQSIKPYLIFSVISILLSLGVSTILVYAVEGASKAVKVCDTMTKFSKSCEGVHTSHAITIASLFCQFVNILVCIASVVVYYEHHPTVSVSGIKHSQEVQPMIMQTLVNADTMMRQPQEI